MIDLTGSYCGTAPDMATWPSRWNADPLLGAALLFAALLAIRLPDPRRTAGLLAVAVLAIAFLSPLCALSVALFSVRAAHHLLLIGVAAPLLAVVMPVRAGPSPALALALALATGVAWVWHLPAAYDAALTDKGLYWIMQASLLASAWSYWMAVRRADPPLALALIGAGAAQMDCWGRS